MTFSWWVSNNYSRMVKNSVSYAFWKGRLANYIQEFKKTTETSDEYDDRDKFCLQLIGKYYRYRVDNSARLFFMWMAASKLSVAVRQERQSPMNRVGEPNSICNMRKFTVVLASLTAVENWYIPLSRSQWLGQAIFIHWHRASTKQNSNR